MDFALPLYSLSVEVIDILQEVYKLKEDIIKHDAIIIATPEHNGSITEYLKNVIDWLSRLVPPKNPFFGNETKPVLLMSTYCFVTRTTTEQI